MRFGIIILLTLAFTSCAVRNQRPELGRTERIVPGKMGGLTPGPRKGPNQPGQQIPLDPIQIQFQQAEELAKQGQNLEALKLFVAVANIEPHTPLQDSARLKSIDLVETKIDQAQIEKVSDNSDYGFARAYALFRLGQASMESRDFRDARKYFSSVVYILPGSDLGIRASDYVAQIDSLSRVEAKTIGVVLPLTGKNAALGQKALRGIQMGLGLHQNSSNFKLAVMDSDGNPDSARRGVERLVKEDNVIAIIGTLQSKTATAVAAKANELGIPSIGLSQKSGLTEVGPSVFRNSLTSEMQIRQLVRGAMAQGMRRFAVLYPNDAFGTEYTNMFWDEVLARGGQIVAAQTYDPKETDFRYPVQRLVGTYYIEARQDEYKLRSHDLLGNIKKSKQSRQNINADDILEPIVDFDGIFIPDSAKAMGQLSAFLSYAGVKNVKLLGTSLWNTPGLAKRAGHFANNILFVDGYWSGSSQIQSSRFYQDYKTQFGTEPSFIEFQAYDSALLLRQLIVQGADSRSELTEKLTGLSRFPGALGELSISANREIIRPVVMLTLDKSGEITPLNSSYKKN